jgi:hypothetical protein
MRRRKRVRGLTAADIHTHYVVAGKVPVLVPAIVARGRDRYNATCTVRKPSPGVLKCGLSAVRSTTGGMLPAMILSFGHLILRQVLQLIILVARSDRANMVAVLVLRHQVVVLAVRSGGWTWNQPTERCRPACRGCCRGCGGRRYLSHRACCGGGTEI